MTRIRHENRGELAGRQRSRVAPGASVSHSVDVAPCFEEFDRKRCRRVPERHYHVGHDLPHPPAGAEGRRVPHRCWQASEHGRQGAAFRGNRGPYLGVGRCCPASFRHLGGAVAQNCAAHRAPSLPKAVVLPTNGSGANGHLATMSGQWFRRGAAGGNGVQCLSPQAAAPDGKLPQPRRCGRGAAAGRPWSPAVRAARTTPRSGPNR